MSHKEVSKQVEVAVKLPPSPACSFFFTFFSEIKCMYALGAGSQYETDENSQSENILRRTYLSSWLI